MYNLSVPFEENHVKLSKEELFNKNSDEQFALFYHRVLEKERYITYSQLKAYTEIYRRNASASYVPAHTCPKNIPIILFRATQTLTALSPEQVKARSKLLEGREQLSDLGWRDFTDSSITVYDVPCSHIQMMDDPYLTMIATIIQKHLQN